MELINSADSNVNKRSYQQIDFEKQAIISDWYHYAILNLMRTKAFRFDPLWISRRLGIIVAETQLAIEHLKRAGMLIIGRDGSVKDSSSKFTSHIRNDKTTEAARENQRQLFGLACKAIDEVEYDERSHTGVTLAFSTNDLERAKAMIGDFRKEFHEVFDQPKEADEVYHLALGFFPLSKNKNKGD